MARHGLWQMVRSGFMHVAVIKYPRFRNATHRADRHGLTGTGDAAGFNHDHNIVGIAAARWRGTR